jgi:hypothetical protein
MVVFQNYFFGKSHYEGGKKYYRRCEVYYCYDGVFCPCCGMALRASPTSKRYKERLCEDPANLADGGKIYAGKMPMISSRFYV